MKTLSALAMALFASIWLSTLSMAADWTQWRFDEHRSAASPDSLPAQLYLQWRRDVPACLGTWDGYPDADYCRPVQLGKTLFVSLQANDSVTAYDTDTGAQKWRYYASGVLCRPPLAMSLTSGRNVVIFGCNDGYVYCLNAADGTEAWKFRGAPNAKKAMGFRRLGSVWPIIASPVAYNNKVYFVAGFLASWGLFGYCLDAETGTVVWQNDGDMVTDGRNSATGPLTISSDHSKIYGASQGMRPWELDLITGKINNNCGVTAGTNEFFVDGNGKSCSTFFGHCTVNIAITAGTQSFTSTNAAVLGVTGTVGDMLTGDGKLFVVTTQGSIYCFGGAQVTPNFYFNQIAPLPAVTDGWTATAQGMLSREDLKQGLALVLGIGSGRLVEELAKQAPGLSIVAVDTDPVKIKALRAKMDTAGWSGSRVSTITGNPLDCGFSPYQAALIASEDVGVAGFVSGAAMVKELYKSARPMGGEIWLLTSETQHAALVGWVTSATDIPLCDIQRQVAYGANGFTQIRRLGLPDEKLALKPPFRLSVFDTSNLSIYESIYESIHKKRDLYTWLPMTVPMSGYEPPAPTRNNVSINSLDSFVSPMLNPLYGYMDNPPGIGTFYPWNNTITYGNLNVCSSDITTFCNPKDNAQYWGTLSFPEIGSGGLRYGKNGVLGFHAWPTKTNGCCCNRGQFNLACSVVPDEDEEPRINYQNARSKQTIQELPVKKVGVNFGAVGDYYLTDEQTLWTHHPAAGRETEARTLIPVTYRGNAERKYRNSAVMENRSKGDHGWVAASQVTGMDGLTVHLADPLVALPTITPPTLDGVLDDACWEDGKCMIKMTQPCPPNIRVGQERSLAGLFSKIECKDGSYAMLRYDAINLYVAGGVRGAYRNGAKGYMVIALKSRENMMDEPILLLCGKPGKMSHGLALDAWQAAYSYSLSSDQPFTAEIAIPWASLAAKGLWKEQLVMNVDVNEGALNGNSLDFSTIVGLEINLSYFTNLTLCFSPVYLDAARGSVASAKSHTVRLYFAEMEDKSAGQRVFDVKLQGQTVLPNLDVVSAAGGIRRELMCELPSIMIADKLDIDFTRKSGEPMLSGVEIIGNYGDLPNLPPVAVITPSVTSGSAPLSVNFSARKSFDPDGQIALCNWSFSDDNLSAIGSLTSHTFTKPGSYIVLLQVTDNNGLTSAIASTTITVNDESGPPSDFICKIRANNGDYTNLSAWQTAIVSDLVALGDGDAIFDVIVTNSNGAITSQGAKLIVNTTPVAPTITTQPITNVVSAGQSATFKVDSLVKTPLVKEKEKKYNAIMQ